MSGLVFLLSRLARAIGIVALVWMLSVLPALAQARAPDGNPDPDASAVHEQMLLQQARASPAASTFPMRGPRC